jgi:hypothetical protein
MIIALCWLPVLALFASGIDKQVLAFVVLMSIACTHASVGATLLLLDRKGVSGQSTRTDPAGNGTDAGQQ